MRLDLFENEAVLDDGGGDISAPVDQVEPAPSDDTADVPAAEAAAPAFDLNDPQVQAQLAGLSQQQTIAVLAELGLVSFDQPQPVGPQAPDPLSDNYAAELEAWYAAKQAQTMAPYTAFIEAQQTAQVDGQIGGVIDKQLAALDVAKPEDPAQAQAFTGVIRAVAESFTGQAVQKYGATPNAAEQAVKMAVEYLAADRKAAGEQAVQAYIKSLNPDKSTPYEPGVRGSGVLGENQPQSEAEVARLWRDRAAV